MNWMDVVVLGVLGISALLGLARGLVREVLGIGAWAGAAAAAVYGFGAAQPVARHFIRNPEIADPVAFGAVFLVVLIVLALLARAVGMVVRFSMLGGLDRTLGLGFGLLRGAALLVAAYIIGAMLIPVELWPPPVLQARSLPFIYEGARWAVNQLPPGYQPRVAPPPQAPAPTARDLLHANPTGRALGPPPGRD